MKSRHPLPLILGLLLCLTSTLMSSTGYSDEALDRPRFLSNPAKYLQIYLKNRRAFAPYSQENLRNPHAQAKLLYRQLCQDRRVKIQCSKYKKKLISFFESQLILIDRPVSSPLGPKDGMVDKDYQEYLTLLDQAVQKLRAHYQEVRGTIQTELKKLLFYKDNLIPGSPEEFNAIVYSAFEKGPIREGIESYRQAYWTAAEAFHGEILLSNTFRGRVEGGFFNIIFSDVILSVDELVSNTRDEFADALLSHEPEFVEFLEGKKNEPITEIASQLLENDLKKDWDRSYQLSPPLADEESFSLIRSFHSNDLEVVRLLSRKDYQRAIWQLLLLGEMDKAEIFEKILTREIMSDENRVGVSPLGGGFTTTQLVRFQNGTAGVYKPKPWSKNGIGVFQNLKDSIVSHYKKEIAAYRINSNLMIGLNQVPIVEKRQIDESVGSLQVYVDHVTMGRFMNEVRLDKPKKAGKWTSPRGRTLLSKDVRLFDWLIDNRDRNIDNFLISDDGRVVLIDHSWSFLNPFFMKPSRKELEAMFPSEALFDKMVQLNQDPRLIDDQLKGLISKNQIRVFKKRLRFIVQVVNQRIQKEGRQHVFK